MSAGTRNMQPPEAARHGESEAAASGPRVLVRGVGDVGSAVAHRLFCAGFAVVLHDRPAPTTTRRRMAFADAVFDGRASLAGCTALRVDDHAALPGLLGARELIAVCTGELAALIEILRPEAMVDARMRKHDAAELQRGMAPLTVGLGPGFVVGEHVDIAVETSWDALGRVITAGATLALAGEPRPIAGHARDRYVYAPTGGRFRTRCQIGDLVKEGEVVASIDGLALGAPIAGMLRGLTRDGVPVKPRTKVLEVDPRGGAGQVAGLGERPRRIAEGVLRAIQSHPSRFGNPRGNEAAL
ncbi:MAG: hypothetical protein L0H73_16900 [Nitrococcus sp.]|nr:hypothetical protein [Nitrococcus sp.]